MKLKYIGHSCFLFVDNNISVLIDPFISKNPIVKESPLDFHPNLILVSHDHFDHVGDSLDIAKANNSTIICENGLKDKLKTENLKIISGTIGDTIKYKHLEISFVKAVHRSDSGIAAGLIIKTSNHTIYFAGDTDYFFDIKDIANKFHPDIAIVPVGGTYTVDANGAFDLIKAIKPMVVIPMHYKTFPALTGTPEKLKELMDFSNLEIKQMTLNFGQEIEI